MESLKEFHGTILMLLIDNIFGIAIDTIRNGSNRVEFIPL